MTDTVDLDLADLSLFPATSEQVRESRSRYAAQWSIGRSLEAYLQRDVVLDADEHAANGKLITWCVQSKHEASTRAHSSEPSELLEIEELTSFARYIGSWLPGITLRVWTFYAPARRMSRLCSCLEVKPYRLLRQIPSHSPRRAAPTFSNFGWRRLRTPSRGSHGVRDHFGIHTAGQPQKGLRAAHAAPPALGPRSPLCSPARIPVRMGCSPRHRDAQVCRRRQCPVFRPLQ